MPALINSKMSNRFESFFPREILYSCYIQILARYFNGSEDTINCEVQLMETCVYDACKLPDWRPMRLCVCERGSVVKIIRIASTVMHM